MAEITAASAEQTASIEQINQAITQMDQVAQQNAALAARRTAGEWETFQQVPQAAETGKTALSQPAKEPAHHS